MTQTVRLPDDTPLGKRPLSEFSGDIVGAAFIARVASGDALDGDLLAVFLQCQDNEARADLLQVVQAQLVTCLDPKRVVVAPVVAGGLASRLSPEMVERSIQEYWAIAQKLLQHGTLTLVQKKPKPKKRMTLLKDGAGRLTGAEMTET